MSIPPQSLNLTKSIPIHHNDNSDVQSPRHIDEKSDETKVNPEFSLLFQWISLSRLELFQLSTNIVLQNLH